MAWSHTTLESCSHEVKRCLANRCRVWSLHFCLLSSSYIVSNTENHTRGRVKIRFQFHSLFFIHCKVNKTARSSGEKQITMFSYICANICLRSPKHPPACILMLKRTTEQWMKYTLSSISLKNVYIFIIKYMSWYILGPFIHGTRSDWSQQKHFAWL